MTRSNQRFWLRLLPLLCVLAALAAPVAPRAWAQAAASDAGNLATGASFADIGPGDVLDVEVFDTPQLSMANARVSQTGDVNLPLIGVVHVAGVNAVEAAVRIAAALRKQGLMIAPHVTVTVLEHAAEGATILGQVRAPGVYPTFGGHRLLDMIALAGGLAPSAGKVVTIAHRDDPLHPVNIILTSGARSFASQRNPLIDPGDTVIVRRAGVIYILGDVKSAGAYMIDNNKPLSLMQAIALAGGWQKTASLSGARLIRKVPGGHEEFKLDLKHILQGKQADMRVRGGDILYVPSSFGKAFAYQGITATTNMASALPYIFAVNN